MNNFKKVFEEPLLTILFLKYIVQSEERDKKSGGLIQVGFAILRLRIYGSHALKIKVVKKEDFCSPVDQTINCIF